MSKQFDITTIGECLVEFTRVEATTYEQSFAGDVFNTLFYASRMGLKCNFMSCFGKDEFTDDFFSLSLNEGINVSTSKVLNDRNNGLYTVNKDRSGKPQYSFWRKNSAATRTLLELDTDTIIKNILDSEVFLLSFIPIAILDGNKKLYDIIEEVRGKTMIYCDMNIRRSLWNDPKEVRFWLGLFGGYVDILSLSREDHLFITHYPDSVLWYQELGYKKIIFRDEGNPVKYYFDSETGEVPTHDTSKIIDSTGAGDAFNAGFLYGYLHDYSTINSVRIGNASAAVSLNGRGGMAHNYSRTNVEDIYRRL